MPCLRLKPVVRSATFLATLVFFASKGRAPPCKTELRITDSAPGTAARAVPSKYFQVLQSSTSSHREHCCHCEYSGRFETQCEVVRGGELGEKKTMGVLDVEVR